MNINLASGSARLSVVVPHYNDHVRCSSLVERLNDEIAPQGNWECIVVDNGSDIPLSISPNSSVQILSCKTPGSYAARNMGVERSRGDYLLFTDSDCMPDNSWLAVVDSFYRNRLNHNKILAGHVEIIPSKVGCENIYESYDCLIGLDQGRYVGKGYAITANLAFSREAYDAVGGFDSRRFSGGDAAFVKKAVLNGYELIYSPEAIVYHPARRTFSEFATKTRRTTSAQLLNGPIGYRILYTARSVLPPVKEFARIISKRGSLSRKLKATCFLFPLWYMRLMSVLQVLLIPRSRPAR